MDCPKLSTPDSEGLQTAERHVFPEVVPGQIFPINNLPEVVPNQPQPVLAHRGSFHQPEVYNTPIEQSQGQKQPLYFADPPPPPGSGYSSHPPRYSNEKQGPGGLEAGQEKRSSRICGMKRRIFIIVTAIVVLVIIVAVVLGAVLGTVLGGSNNSNSNSTSTSNGSQLNGPSSLGTNVSAPQPIANTGLAVLQPPNDPRVYSYYQAANGSIWETQYFSDPWAGPSAPFTQMIAGSDILFGSPVSAISYVKLGDLYRQVFYFDANGIVTTSNTTGNNTWSEPYNIFSGALSVPKTPALSACVGTSSTGGLNGIRVYYGGVSPVGNVIQEAGTDFGSAPYPQWWAWNNFTASDAGSGAACAVMGNYSHIYMYNTTSKNLVQWSWDYYNESSSKWQLDNAMAPGSSVSAASDDISTDYVFYQTTLNKSISTLWINGSFSNYNSDIAALSISSIGDTLATTFSNGQAVIINQNSTAPDQILYTTLDRSGNTCTNSSFVGSV